MAFAHKHFGKRTEWFPKISPFGSGNTKIRGNDEFPQMGRATTGELTDYEDQDDTYAPQMGSLPPEPFPQMGSENFNQLGFGQEPFPQMGDEPWPQMGDQDSVEYLHNIYNREGRVIGQYHNSLPNIVRPAASGRNKISARAYSGFGDDTSNLTLDQLYAQEGVANPDTTVVPTDATATSAPVASAAPATAPPTTSNMTYEELLAYENTTPTTDTSTSVTTTDTGSTVDTANPVSVQVASGVSASTIPVYGPTATSAQIAAGQVAPAPSTASNTNMILYGVAAAIALGAFFFVGKKKRA